MASEHADDIDAALREWLPHLRRFAQWLTRDASAADDLVQSTLERAISRWSQHRQASSLRAWLFAIAHRQFIDQRRRASRYAWMLDRLRSAPEPVEPSLEQSVQAQLSLAALQRLPEAQRHLLLWVAVEGLSYREVADILEVPIGTVMSRLSRARAAFREASEGHPSRPALRLLSS
ncbi:sigma-70 family RNA polymerase sigma factor [Oleiagrimonas sp. C23AA]|uniref:RNA polymerase sigma factor n=1 Tax=Oleiagrimonas sp. C23AA TaxID=2719047 RepID=UPI00141EF44F|nr:sigma-70 family RNA polymerase sigma factor [Oleiagrimonas sp. C23AA]NII09260.1 sigma-70 family RNA polymerase sigma factor [Oleiagrimonas sp. C23AA]